MSAKVILVLSDALRYDTAVNQMGFMGHLVETKVADFYKVLGELPSISRPMYETVHTGLSAMEHGVVSNRIVRRSTKPNIFQAAKDAGKTTAASACFWYSELYNHAPYEMIDDREVDDESLLIQHGRFYFDDAIPLARLATPSFHVETESSLFVAPFPGLVCLCKDIAYGVKKSGVGGGVGAGRPADGGLVDTNYSFHIGQPVNA